MRNVRSIRSMSVEVKQIVVGTNWRHGQRWKGRKSTDMKTPDESSIISNYAAV